MPIRRKGGFFTQTERPEDEAARQREVEALLVGQRTFPQEIGVERIEPNPFQARRAFTNLEELAATMREQGFISRLRVRPHPDRPNTFQLVYGERRLRAARLAGLTEVPCDVADHTDADLLEIGLAENIQRRDLNPLEEAHAFQTFITERGYSIRRLADRIGKDKSYIEDRLILLRVPDDVQEMVVQRPDTLRSAREIAKLPAEERRGLIDNIVAGSVSSRQVREHVRERQEGTRRLTNPLPSSTQQQIERDAQRVQTILARWQLLAREDEHRDQIAANTESLLLAMQHLITTLES